MAVLIRRISHLYTGDDDGREHQGVDVLVEGRTIAAVGRDLAAPPDAEVLDGDGLIVTPGLVNGHQHLYQVGLRALPELERTTIGPWLRGVTHRCLTMWRNGIMDPDGVAAIAAAGMVESLLGGVTTVADQHYFFPGGSTLPFVERTIEAAAEVGLRFHAGRGSITLGREDGGTAPDAVVQRVDEVLKHSYALIERYHDPDPLAMTRIDLAPCGVHADRLELFTEMAALAAVHPGVGLHTHLYEVIDTEFCQRRYGTTPWRILLRHGWHSERVWLAHVVDPPPEEIPEFAAAGVGVVHLIGPDLRMGWGLAPVRAMLEAGVNVGFGTTGSASNDGANLLGDLRVAALAHRSGSDRPLSWLSARELLRMATRGSARCLSRPALGVIAPGFAADLAAWDLTTVDRVGIHDPVAGLIMTGLSDRAHLVLVDGRVVVRDGRCTTVDERAVARRARRALRMAYAND
jgi:8-oxoguanine deaminase